MTEPPLAESPILNRGILDEEGSNERTEFNAEYTAEK
jgi:hypothetical protein